MDKEKIYNKEVNIITIEDFISLFSSSESCDKWFSPKEMETFPFPERARSLAARYMVKKAICEKLNKIKIMYDIEILNNSFGKPEIIIGKDINMVIEERGMKKILCSLSHSKIHAIGMTIFCY